MIAIGKLLRPLSVAVIGASADPSKMTGRHVSYLQNSLNLSRSVHRQV